jgi:hypothetical protein
MSEGFYNLGKFSTKFGCGEGGKATWVGVGVSMAYFFYN